MPTVLVSTWSNGVFVQTHEGLRHELAGEPVRDLQRDANGDALAVVGGRALCRRAANGEWRRLADGAIELACCMAVGPVHYAGTEEASVLRVGQEGTFERLDGFDHVAGRERWYAGSALVDGRLMGPPLGVRSMTVTCDRAALLANVHVGGIPRSSDGGMTWQPTIDIDCDVHQVCAHPTRRGIVAAAAGAGLCMSRDGGLTWTIDPEGLHAPYCLAVAFVGDEVLVAASTDHFAQRAAVYARPIDGPEPMRRVGGGLPQWLDGIVDSGNIAVYGDGVAVADRSGSLYVSEDAGRSFERRAEGIPGPSSVLMC